MPYYLVQGAYSHEQWAAFVKNPQQNRAELARTLIESMGGRLLCFFWSFGEYDALWVAELPDATTVAAIVAAIEAGGIKAAKTTPLLTPEEGIEFLKKASQVGYRPPSA